MKIRKTISALCAAAMLLCAAPFASAAEAESDDLSMYAGETIQVGITHVHEDGETTQQVIDVYIPEDATEKEGNEIICQAAQLAENGPARAARLQNDLLYAVGGPPDDSGVNLYTTNKYLSGTTLEQDYEGLLLQFNGVTAYDGATHIYARYVTDNASYIFSSDAISGIYCQIVIADNRLDFTAGTAFNLYCSVNAGRVNFMGLLVYGQY